MRMRAVMRRACLAAVAALAVLAFETVPVKAYEFTGTFAGGDCKAMARAADPARLWYGHFTGRRQSPWNLDFIEGKTVEGCFTAKAQCENWLYQWRSAWQFDFWNDFCSLGYPPPPRGFRPRTQGQ